MNKRTKAMERLGTALLLGLVALAAAGCSDKKAPQGELLFWHTQAQQNGKLLQEIVDAYNATGPPMKVSARYIGGYGALFRKVRVTIPTGRLPDLVVAYESMVAEYVESEAVVALDDYIADPKIGLSKESLADIFPSILANNRMQQTACPPPLMRTFGKKNLSWIINCIQIKDI